MLEVGYTFHSTTISIRFVPFATFMNKTVCVFSCVRINTVFYISYPCFDHDLHLHGYF